MTWNVNRRKSLEVAKELPAIEVVLMQELKVRKADMTEVDARAAFHGAPKKTGVGSFREQKENAGQVKWVQNTSQHTAVVYSVEGSDGLLVSAYQPTQGRSVQDFDEALDISRRSSSRRLTGWVWIGGDFNFTAGTWLSGEVFGDDWWQEREPNARACAVRAWAQLCNLEDMTTRGPRYRPRKSRRGRQGQRDGQLDYTFGAGNAIAR